MAKSQELGAAFVLLTGFLVLLAYGTSMYRYMANFMIRMLSPEMFVYFQWNEKTTDYFFLSTTYYVAHVVSPFFIIICIVGLIINYIQVGMRLSLQPLAPNLKKINPISGFGRIFSLRSLTELVKNILKISLVGFITYFHMRGEMVQVVKLHDITLMAGMVYVAVSIFKLVMKMCVLLIILAILDYVYQKWDFEKSMRMTKQEVKDEHKQREGDPLVRSRIRQKQREIAYQRMMAEVPKADVVITNPIHVAVALSYKAEEMHAPKVVAKGGGDIAERIKEIAKENHVPIIEDKPLAQSLFKMCEVGDYVPPNLFKAVAEILAYVYRLGHKQHEFGI